MHQFHLTHFAGSCVRVTIDLDQWAADNSFNSDRRLATGATHREEGHSTKDNLQRPVILIEFFFNETAVQFAYLPGFVWANYLMISPPTEMGKGPNRAAAVRDPGLAVAAFAGALEAIPGVGVVPFWLLVRDCFPRHAAAEDWTALMITTCPGPQKMSSES